MSAAQGSAPIPATPLRDVDEEAAAEDEDSAPACPYCLEPAGARSIRAPCRCRGSLGLVHEECLRHDLSANHRTACSVCHEPYEIAHDSIRRSLAQRLRAAVAAQPGHLAAVTLGSACFSAVFLLMFVGFQVGKLPLASFPVRDARGAKYATLSLGVGAALVGCLAWRGAVAAQPAAEVRRTLLSAPDQKSGEREPLLQLRVDEGPPPPGWRPALEAARRAAARDARLAAVAAATRAHAAAVAASPARTATSATPRIYHDDARPVRW